MFKIEKLTIDNLPPRTSQYLLYRHDSRRWENVMYDKEYIGNPGYAYTHWTFCPAEPSEFRFEKV